jgi:hypothetical protein
LHQAFVGCDKAGTGFLDPQLFCRIINGIVIPINYEDFRFMMRSVSDPPSLPPPPLSLSRLSSVDQIQSDDQGNYSYRHFLTLYDPNRQPHELSGVATITAQAENIYNQSLNHSLSAPILGSNSNSSSQSMRRTEDHERPQEEGSNDRGNNELKKLWHNALRMCKAQDTDKTGFIRREIFLASLEHHLGKVRRQLLSLSISLSLYLSVSISLSISVSLSVFLCLSLSLSRDLISPSSSQSLSSDEINSLANSYSAGDDVDYHTCFRSCLNNVMNGPTSNNKSIFQIAPLTKPRDSGASHPWDFNYQLNQSAAAAAQSHSDDSTLPYWKRACVDPRARPATTLAPPSSLDSGGSLLSFGLSKTLPATSSLSVDVSSYEPKVVNICRKIVSNPSFRQLKDELKRSQLINYKGCISIKNWSAILANNASFSLTKSENGTLGRIFRAKGIPDTINYKDFLDVCLAVQ